MWRRPPHLQVVVFFLGVKCFTGFLPTIFTQRVPAEIEGMSSMPWSLSKKDEKVNKTKTNLVCIICLSQISWSREAYWETGGTSEREAWTLCQPVVMIIQRSGSYVLIFYFMLTWQLVYTYKCTAFFVWDILGTDRAARWAQRCVVLTSSVALNSCLESHCMLASNGKQKIKRYLWHKASGTPL